MIRLNMTTDARWVDLLPGLRLVVWPVTTTIMAAARADAALNDLDDDSPREMLAVTMAQAVARRIVVDWTGVGDDDGNPLPVTPEGIDALLNIWPVFEAFQEKVLGPYLVLDAEKNVSAPSPNGISAGATDIATPAPDAAPTALPG
ncbi:hypothetical protein [Paracoccus sanguinis]|uniref:Uncharacterized protein n=1 Tax=Paracoccus sanguinis TaxID=1545044 RepID=A0A099GL30_9RHOB|nr:hypothetical protein [Paracoccus sanguinis]KGJ23505.1 hypothetical protein IX56_01710 [Paracoccus sanguinis]